MIWRYHLDCIRDQLKPGKVLVVYGPRRAGKTTLIETYLAIKPGRAFVGTGDDMVLRSLLETQNLARFKQAFGGYDLIVIDEAQRVGEIGFALKLIVDHLPDAAVLVTGSSSFDLSNSVGDPLTGRHRVLTLYPIAALEMVHEYGPLHVSGSLEDYLVFGMYPEALQAGSHKDRRDYLATLIDSYLFKDVLQLENVRRSDKLLRLLQLLAYQIGQDVSISELAGNVGLAQQTVERYLDLLEKSFVIIRLGGFSRNLRKEITKSSRFFFVDNGVRNAVINNFNPVAIRGDVGMLWENLMLSERRKRNGAADSLPRSFFWRTYDQQEIDLVEEEEGRLAGYEFKWGTKAIRAPGAWRRSYPDAGFQVINQDNWLSFCAEVGPTVER